nr:CYP4AP7 protein [Diaphanosoma celebensis]
MILYISATACSVIILCLVLMTLFRLWYKTLRFNCLLNRLPGPPFVPLVGNSQELSGAVDDLLEILCNDWARKYGGIYKAYIGPKPHIMISSPDIIQVMLSSPRILDKGITYYFLCPWLGEGLLTSTEGKWLLRRCLLTPAYESQLADVMETSNEEMIILSHQIDKNIENGDTEMDIYPLVSRCALDMICEIAAGQAVNAQTEDSEYVDAIFSMSDIIAERIQRPLCWDDAFFINTDLGERHETTLPVLHQFTEKVVRNRRTYGSLLTFRRSLLDGFLETTAGMENLCDEDVKEELDTFIFKGFQSLSSIISWFLYCMAANPPCQEQLRQELNLIFEARDRDCCLRDLSDMKYVDNCLKEVLRLYPSVPLLTRAISEDVQLGGYKIPAGCDAMVLVYALHHNPQFYPNPETFCPERFFPEKAVARHPFAYIPFGAGPRNCIGQEMAVSAIKAVVSGLLRRFRFQIDPDRMGESKPVSRMFLKPRDGIRLMVSRC